MHPLQQLLLLNIIITVAVGQQSFYSNNGQSNSPATHFLSHSQPQQQPNSYNTNIGYPQPYNSNSHGYSQSSFGSNPTPQSYQSPTQQTYQSPTSQTYQSSPHTSYQAQSYNNPQQTPSQSQQTYSYASPVNPPNSFNNYGTSPTYVPVASSIASYPQQQPPTSFNYAVSPSANPYSNPLPQLSNQPQQQTYPNSQVSLQTSQNQFSQRQLNYNQAQQTAHGNPYGSPPNIAMNPPPTTMATSSGFSQPTAAGPGLSSHQLLSRRGPFDGMINRAKEWMPSLKKNRGKGSGSYTSGMSEMNRIPKPPKYPLYDMAGMGLATPPPPPLMSPMSQLPSNIFSSFQAPGSSGGAPSRGNRPMNNPSSSSHPPRRIKGNNNNKRRRNRPPPPPPPPAPKYRNNKRQRPRVNGASSKVRGGGGGGSYSNKVPITEGFDHPMASNMASANSPPLGRPLGFDEYMKRPTHSFTDDPWNFDPNAQSYNEGMNTHAMKYNYDPLGTNALDTSVQSHLDISKMSYPGDVMNMDSMKEPAKPLHSQLGGWDLPPAVYRSGQPSPGSNQHNSNYNRYDDHPRTEVAPPPYEDNWSTTTSTTTRNSFTQYDPVTEASIVKSETLSPITLISGSDGAIEFDIDSLKGNSGSSSNNNNNYDNNHYNKQLSDHYSPAGESHVAAHQQQHSNYDQYSSSNYNSYSRGNSYGSRHTRANAHNAQQPQQQNPHSPLLSKVKSSSSSLTEGMDLFHDFIKDPNPGVGKARARHHLYKALLS